MAERILLMGGPLWAENVLRALKEIGFEVILTDINPDCPGRQYADHFFNISATDTDDILSAIAPFDSIAIAYCGNDFGTTGAHRINEALAGRSLMEADPRIFIDKNEMKAFFEAHDLDAARGTACSLSELDADALAYPTVVKPIAASGAIGVRYVEDADALRSYVTEFTGSFEDVLVEEVLVGTQHDINGFFVNGRFSAVGLSDRYFADYPLCYPIYGHSPAQLDDAALQACYDSLEAIGKAAGLVTGPLKSDLFVRADGSVSTTEVGLRFHGDITSCIVLPNTGQHFPLLEYLRSLTPSMALAIDEYLGHTYFASKHVVRWDILRSRTGRFVGLKGLDKVEKHPGVVDVLLAKKPGAELRQIRDNRDILGYVLTRGDDYEECASNAAWVRDNLGVDVDVD